MKILIFITLLAFNHASASSDENCPSVAMRIKQALRSLTLSERDRNGPQKISSNIYTSVKIDGGKWRWELNPGMEHEQFQGQGIFEFAEKNPEYAKKIGIVLREDQGKKVVEYIGPQEFNLVGKNMRKRNDHLAPHFRFKLVDVDGEIPTIDYINFLSQGIVPMTNKGRLYFHDMGVHFPAWVYLPKEIKDSIVNKMKILSQLYSSPVLSSKNKEIIMKIIEREVKNVDLNTATITVSLRLYKNNPSAYSKKIVADLFAISEGEYDYKLINFETDLVLTPSERQFVEGVLKNNPQQKLSHNQIEDLQKSRVLP